MLGLALSLRADSHHTSRQISVSSPEGRHRRRTAEAEAAQTLGRAILDSRHRIRRVVIVVVRRRRRRPKARESYPGWSASHHGGCHRRRGGGGGGGPTLYHLSAGAGGDARHSASPSGSLYQPAVVVAVTVCRRRSRVCRSRVCRPRAAPYDLSCKRSIEGIVRRRRLWVVVQLSLGEMSRL